MGGMGGISKHGLGTGHVVVGRSDETIFLPSGWGVYDLILI